MNRISHCSTDKAPAGEVGRRARSVARGPACAARGENGVGRFSCSSDSLASTPTRLQRSNGGRSGGALQARTGSEGWATEARRRVT